MNNVILCSYDFRSGSQVEGNSVGNFEVIVAKSPPVGPGEDT